MLTADFDYELPESAIAQSPAEPRDSSRLLVTADMSDHVFSELPDLLGPDDIVVVNDTRVRAARIHLTKAKTGGAVEMLLLDRLENGNWEALVRPARRLRRGTRLVGEHLEARLESDPVDGIAEVALEASEDVEAVIDKAGEVPLPPYITASLADPSRYQTVYARTPGSAAAPTAGLHFTEELLERLERKTAGIARVELRVGLGTFRPIQTERVSDHRMHREWVSVPAETVDSIARATSRGGRVVAVGTTVVRALETAAREGELRPWTGHTDLFITPGFRFRVVDRLVTNFHMPRSSLLVMIAAFMGPGWREAYSVALQRGYRFLSFGDAMLCDREQP